MYLIDILLPLQDESGELRSRVGRLHEEGSDMRHEQEMLEYLSANLGELYWIRL